MNDSNVHNPLLAHKRSDFLKQTYAPVKCIGVLGGNCSESRVSA